MVYTKAFSLRAAAASAVHPQRIPHPLQPKKEEKYKSAIQPVSLSTFLPLLEEDEGYFMAF